MMPLLFICCAIPIGGILITLGALIIGLAANNITFLVRGK